MNGRTNAIANCLDYFFQRKICLDWWREMFRSFIDFSCGLLKNQTNQRL